MSRPRRAFVLIGLALAACRGTEARFPVHTALPASARRLPAIPQALEQEITRAVVEVNTSTRGRAGLPEWRLEDAEPIAGLVVEEYTLGDGPRLLFIADPSARAVRVNTYFEVANSGAVRLSPDAARAAAELLRRAPADEGLRELEALGVTSACGSSGGLVWLGLSWPVDGALLSDPLPRALALGVEPFTHPRPISATAWSAITARTWKKRTLDAKTLLERALADRWPVTAGAVTALDELDPARAEAARAALFAPERAVLSVSGDVDRVRLLTELRRALGPATVSKATLTRTSTPTAERAPPSWFTGTVSIPGDAEVLLVAWPLPPARGRDRLVFDALGHLLAGGEGSRLGRALLGREAVGVEARIRDRARGSTFELFVALELGQTATRALSLVDRELADLGSRGPTTAEVEVARATLDRDLLADLTELDRRVDRVARTWLEEGGASTLEKGAGTRGVTSPGDGLRARLAPLRSGSLEASELQRAAAKHLGPRPRATLTGRPRARGPKEGAR